jgi:hypothetical protein
MAEPEEIVRVALTMLKKKASAPLRVAASS